ncbi:MAG: hypothetical protein IJZ30_03290 [Alphaproteobacteria bacterium]|nr:hypothetical protein [Alphaproteobacteria bacterium]
MSDKKDLISELKQDAQKAWEFIENCANKIGKYGLLVLSLVSDGNAQNQDFAPIKEQEIKNEISANNFNKKIQVYELNNKNKIAQNATSNVNWEDVIEGRSAFIPYQKTIDERAEELYEKAKGAKISSNVSVNDLMENAGVTVDDMQAVINENPEILFQFKSGPTSAKLARSADRVNGALAQNCLAGVQTIFDNARCAGILSGDSAKWPKKIGGGRHNSACNSYIPLEESGKFITVSVENKAHNHSKHSPENEQMREFCQKMPEGSIVICDNKIPDYFEGRRYNSLVNQYGEGGPVHGHICVKDNHGQFKSDGTEPNGPNFARYGETVRFSIPKDMEVPKEVALTLIKQAEIRRQNEQEAKNNSQNQTMTASFFMQQRLGR